MFSQMREVEISEFVRAIAKGEGRYDPSREALAHVVASALKKPTAEVT